MTTPTSPDERLPDLKDLKDAGFLTDFGDSSFGIIEYNQYTDPVIAFRPQMNRPMWIQEQQTPGKTACVEDLLETIDSGRYAVTVIPGELSICLARYGTGEATRPEATCVRIEGHPLYAEDGVGHSHDPEMSAR